MPLNYVVHIMVNFVINLHDCTVYCSITFKMLGLYLYILIIGHKSCSMLSAQNKSILQKKLQNFGTDDEFLDKK